MPKKNKALKNVQEDYKARIGKLLTKKKVVFLSTQNLFKPSILSQTLYKEENT